MTGAKGATTSPFYGKYNCTPGPAGSGFQAHCFSCGAFGHPAAECPSKSLGKGGEVKGVEVEPQEEPSRVEASVEIGRVWSIGAVQHTTTNYGRNRYFKVLDEEDGAWSESDDEPPSMVDSSSNGDGNKDLGEVSEEEDDFLSIARVRRVWVGEVNKVPPPPAGSKGWARPE